MFMDVIKLLRLLMSIFVDYQRNQRAKAIHSVKASVKKMSDSKVATNLKQLMKKG